mgnify:FL=1
MIAAPPTTTAVAPVASSHPSNRSDGPDVTGNPPAGEVDGPGEPGTTGADDELLLALGPGDALVLADGRGLGLRLTDGLPDGLDAGELDGHTGRHGTGGRYPPPRPGGTDPS